MNNCVAWQKAPIGYWGYPGYRIKDEFGVHNAWCWRPTKDWAVKVAIRRHNKFFEQNVIHWVDL